MTDICLLTDMNLCIDQGNSRTKIAIFDAEGHRINDFVFKQFAARDLQKLFSLYPIENTILSSVVNIEPSIVNLLTKKSHRFILFDYETPLPIRNAYDTPETLGQDRIAAAVGAASLAPGRNLLIIDAGSAITYDFVSLDETYLGGNIAPGLKMRFQALKQQTKKLPLVEIDEKQIIPLFGRNTHDAILSGVVRGVRYEIEGYMRALEHQVGDFEVYLTGGNSAYIGADLRRNVHVEKLLVLIGLNRILEHNLSLK